ncbi:hypothetical protein CBR_g36261 [Chara braunii]|uniref:Uncharacterized protein n=1 Tax=Chara braunii TaxID=69332 RepID=A0A388LKI1_CHABU|nr:hypothetical protein CBR_g36261 [Chara braunii]|eukprot:GBG82732.1 hypothetical protein CBR_g36261 [Chara braunii]
MWPRVQVEVYGATIDRDLEPPELIEGDLVELTIPGRSIRHADGQFAWRSIILSEDMWLWTYREHRPGQGVGVVKAYLYLGPGAVKEVVVGLATTGTSDAVSRALRYLGNEVAAFRAEDSSDPLTLFHGRPPLDITGELVIARDGFFPYSVRSLREIVPTFVVESVFGGIGGVVETYLAYQDLKILARRPADLDYIYYSLATGGPRWGDERVQLIELIRSIDDEWPQSPCVWDWLDRELRAGPEYVTCIGRLFSDDWGSWWSEDAGRPLIYGHQLTEYYQAIGQAPYRVEDESDDEGWEREDDEELWEPDWVDPESEVDEDEIDVIDAHFPRIGVAVRCSILEYLAASKPARDELQMITRKTRIPLSEEGQGAPKAEASIVGVTGVTARADRMTTVLLDGMEGVPPDKFYILGSGAVETIINDGAVLDAVIDNGSEAVIIDEDLAVQVGLGLDRSYLFEIEIADGRKQQITGVCHKAAIEVQGVRVTLPVFAVKNCSSDLLLGRTRLSHVHAVTIERPDGSQTLSIKKPDGTRVMIETVEPRGPRNRAALAVGARPGEQIKSLPISSRAVRFRENKYGPLLTEEEGRMVEVEDLGSRLIVDGNSYPKEKDEEFGGVVSVSFLRARPPMGGYPSDTNE